MCTAISYKTKDHYFGRTMDYEVSYGERVLILPRGCKINFRKLAPLSHHYGMIGMGIEKNDFPLFFEATNEKGLSMAGLNFPDNACYYPEDLSKSNVTPFELIPWVLGQCADVSQAKSLLAQCNVVDIAFSAQLPLSPLHWMIADQNSALTVETLQDGMHIYENPIGVLTNNPPFETQRFMLNQYINLSALEPSDRFAPEYKLERYSRGMGALGLPGDLSSGSRFVRAAFTKLNSVCESDEMSSVTQLFHILGTVAQTRGCAVLEDGSFEITRYTSCCNTDRGLYYFTTYDNSRICCVDLHQIDLDRGKIIQIQLPERQDVHLINIHK